MCRILGCVAAEPISIEHELLHAENPLIQQSEDHDSGWGMAVYRPGRTASSPSSCGSRRRHTATASSTARPRCAGASSTRTCGARRMGGLTLVNTHPFVHGRVLVLAQRHRHPLPEAARARAAAAAGRDGLRAPVQLADVPLRPRHIRAVAAAARQDVHRALAPSPASTSSSRTASASTRTSSASSSCTGSCVPGRRSSPRGHHARRGWHTVQQDVLLVLDPDNPESPHAERLVGDEWIARGRDREVRAGTASPRRRARRRSRPSAPRASRRAPPSERAPARALRQPGRRGRPCARRAARRWRSS